MSEVTQRPWGFEPLAEEQRRFGRALVGRASAGVVWGVLSVPQKESATYLLTEAPCHATGNRPRDHEAKVLRLAVRGVDRRLTLRLAIGATSDHHVRHEAQWIISLMGGIKYMDARGAWRHGRPGSWRAWREVTA